MSNHGIDYARLDRLMDRTKADTFLGQRAAFYGPLLCSQELVWTDQIPTAGVDGVHLYVNPEWFEALPKATRKTVLMHELYHVGNLHGLRRGNRDPKIWNYACDIRVNNDLEKDGYTFEGTQPWKDQTFGDMPPEDIYDELIKNPLLNPPCNNPWGNTGKPFLSPDGRPCSGDMIDPTNKSQDQKVINQVVQAAHAARASGNPGAIPGETETYLKKFLTSIIPWESYLYRWCSDLLESDYDWRTRDRRFREVYLPGEVDDEGRLEHLIWYWDVSGSVNDQQSLRMASEVAHIKAVFKPKKLTVAQFDTRITSEKTWTEDEPFEDVVIIGRGGTDLEPVRQHMMKHKPTAAVVFSDLWCDPMASLDQKIPLLWVAVDNQLATVPFGEIIYIRS